MPSKEARERRTGPRREGGRGKAQFVLCSCQHGINSHSCHEQQMWMRVVVAATETVAAAAAAAFASVEASNERTSGERHQTHSKKSLDRRTGGWTRRTDGRMAFGWLPTPVSVRPSPKKATLPFSLFGVSFSFVAPCFLFSFGIAN